MNISQKNLTIVLVIIIFLAIGLVSYFVFVQKSEPYVQLESPVEDQTSTKNFEILDEGESTVTAEVFITSDADMEFARQALITYFDLLSKKQYIEAFAYHGSGYQYLQDWNPLVSIDDHESLIKYGCERSGLQCLKIKNIVTKTQISKTEFKFVVQFLNKDGTLFKRGPCCGATEEQMPTRTDFEYLVQKVNNEFLVRTQPVYVP